MKSTSGPNENVRIRWWGVKWWNEMNVVSRPPDVAGTFWNTWTGAWWKRRTKAARAEIFRSNCVTWIVELDTSTTLAAICLLTDESCECCECSLPVQWARHAELSTSDDLSTAAIHNFYIAQMNFGGPWFRLSNFVAVVQFHLLGDSFAFVIFTVWSLLRMVAH